MGTLVYKNGFLTGASNFFAMLDTLLTNPFSTIEPRGLGWSSFYKYGNNDKSYFSLGISKSERIYLRLTANDDTHISRQISQCIRPYDGYMINVTGGRPNSNIIFGGSQIEYWIVGNQDFFHIVILDGSTYNHYYCGIINRFAPAQNSSIYGPSPPNSANTIIPYPSAYTISSNTTLYLRTGFDAYGGFDATNTSFVPGQKLAIIDQSTGTSTTGNIGIVILNNSNIVNNSINVSYLSGANSFSSFAIISVDPQPLAINTNGTVHGNHFLMVDDFVGELSPQFDAVNEFSGIPPENIQNPNIRGVYLTMPIRLSNVVELRGTLHGLIETPFGAPSATDIFQTFDGKNKFVNFPDGMNNMVAIGSIV